jgi:hypothetical protein
VGQTRGPVNQAAISSSLGGSIVPFLAKSNTGQKAKKKRILRMVRTLQNLPSSHQEIFWE